MNFFAGKKPFIIAGPCSAESMEQMQAIGQSFVSMHVDMIRAGVWKPRSKPGYFEGAGEPALAWLQEVRRISSKPICTEVANKEQVELALHYELDAVWIGARTTVNPFMVQEIAEALKGTQVKVLVKNPINPDVDLWSGAIERLINMGVQDIAAIHRGFSSFDETSKYRNKPTWAIPIELKRRYKELPIITDISHIAGNRELLSFVAQRALDLDFDGLMIETHPNPDKALSDAKQQITPEALHDLLANLKPRQAILDSSTEIESIRQVLDSMDAEIIEIVGKRMELVKELARIKGENNMPIFQQERWREIVETRTEWGTKNNLNNEFVLKIFELIHDKSIKTQLDFLNTLNK